MHSSRMRTVRCSGHLGEGGSARGGSAQVGCLPGVSTWRCLSRGVSAQGCLPRGVSAHEGCLPRKGCLPRWGICLGDVCWCLPRGCLPRGVCLGECLPRRGVCPGGYLPGGCLPRGCLPMGVCLLWGCTSPLRTDRHL